MSTRPRPALPALLTAFGLSAGSVASAAVVALPRSAPPLLLAAADSAASRPVEVGGALAPENATGNEAAQAGAQHCAAGRSACAPHVATEAPQASGDEGRYDFYWRISVAPPPALVLTRVGASGTSTRADPAWRDAALDDPIDAALSPRLAPAAGDAPAQAPWLFVDGGAAGGRGADGAFVLVADHASAGDAAADPRLGGASARLPSVDEPVDALPEPPAWALLGGGLALLAAASRWRRRRRD